MSEASLGYGVSPLRARHRINAPKGLALCARTIRARRRSFPRGIYSKSKRVFYSQSTANFQPKTLSTTPPHVGSVRIIGGSAAHGSVIFRGKN